MTFAGPTGFAPLQLPGPHHLPSQLRWGNVHPDGTSRGAFQERNISRGSTRHLITHRRKTCLTQLWLPLQTGSVPQATACLCQLNGIIGERVPSPVVEIGAGVGTTPPGMGWGPLAPPVAGAGLEVMELGGNGVFMYTRLLSFDKTVPVCEKI